MVRLVGMEILPASHLDHGLTAAHLAFLVERFGGRDGFVLETVILPDDLPDLMSGIYGPIVGDPPVGESEVAYRVRGDRRCASRIVDRPVRPTRQLTVIAGSFEGKSCVLFTAYGGPCAPREPGDLAHASWEGILESRLFWMDHALSSGA